MDNNIDIQIEKILKACLASKVEDQETIGSSTFTPSWPIPQLLKVQQFPE